MNESLDVTNVLKRALDAVNEAGIPDELKPLALEKAIDLYAGAGTSSAGAGSAAAAPGGAGGEGGAGDSAATVVNNATAVQKIAARLKIPPDTVDEVYDQDANGLRIVLGTAKFDEAKRAGAKQLALLYAAGRQAADDEDWTPMRDIREVVKDFNRFDSANFAFTISQMDDVFLFRGNSAQSREVKVNRQGYERAAALISGLTGSGASS